MKLCKKTRVAIGAGLLAAVLGLLVCRSSRRTPLTVSISIKGITTLPLTQETRLASFCISNAGKFSVIEIPPDLYEMRPENPCFDVIPWSVGWPTVLKPGQSAIIYVPVPSRDDQQWKATFKLTKFDWRFRLGNMHPKMQSVAAAIIPNSILRVREQFDVANDWITNAESTRAIPEAGTRDR